jgi:hypothetical protein
VSHPSEREHYQAGGMKSRAKIGKTFHNVSFREWRQSRDCNVATVYGWPLDASAGSASKKEQQARKSNHLVFLLTVGLSQLLHLASLRSGLWDLLAKD